MKALINKIYNFTLHILLLTAIVLAAVGISFIVYIQQFSNFARDEHVRTIYKQIVAATGQTQDALPLEIVDEPIDNAYNDGSEIVIYTGLINHTKSWDEIALVLGHETAHGMLGHLSPTPPFVLQDGMGANDGSSMLEANADKMGAFYMMRAGYDICKGRQIYKRWQLEQGNFIGLNHPDFSYRYDELNINCN